jgi:hypothetical protein
MIKRTTKVERESRRSCSNCGRLGHRSATCQHGESRINMLGVELEGYFLDLAATKRLSYELTGREGEPDGSLDTTGYMDRDEDENDCCSDPDCDDDDCRANRPSGTQAVRGWEFQTKADQLSGCLRQVTALYPDGTSPKCGMHVHVSFKHWSDATMLVSDDFMVYFRERMKAWGTARSIHRTSEFWKRLNGENQYCRINPPVTESRRGSIIGGSDKYCQINYGSYSQYQTIEFRLLPMFQLAKLGVSAIEEIVDIVETYLDMAANLGEIYSVESDPIPVDDSPTVVIPDAVLEITDGMLADISSVDHTLEIDAFPEPRPGHIAVLQCDALEALRMALEALNSRTR